MNRDLSVTNSFVEKSREVTPRARRQLHSSPAIATCACLMAALGLSRTGSARRWVVEPVFVAGEHKP